MKSFAFRTDSAQCSVWIGKGVLDRRPRGWLKPGRALILADRRLIKGAQRLMRSLEQEGWQVTLLPCPAGEMMKAPQTIQALYGKLLRNGADRDSVVFALGGGALGDAAGFVAGTFLRGIRWVGVPTTLLSQVDSALGGKTGMNHPEGKNLIGVFHQPTAILCELEFLETLSLRDQVSGFGEVIKYGLIMDPSLYRKVEGAWQAGTIFQPLTLEKVVARCLKLKASLVQKDERDVLGFRQILNFGHTLGHSLENEAGYGAWRHGEAVIFGMRVAIQLSILRGHLNPKVGERIEKFLAGLPVPSISSKISDQKLMKRVQRDKKLKNGQVHFVLLSGIGKTVVDSGVLPRDILIALRRVRTGGASEKK